MDPVDDRPLPEGLSDRLGFLLGRAHAANRRLAEARLAGLGIGVKTIGALTVLADEGPLSQQQLGQRMGVDRTTMVAVTNELDDLRLVTRERNPRDRRAYTLRLTGTGRRLLRRATTAAERAEAEFLAELSPAERQQLKALLRRLIAP